MPYKVIIAPEAALDLQRLGKNEPKAFAKALRFIEYIPRQGLVIQSR